MEPQITIVATAHQEKRYQCPLIDSMLNQTNPHWKMIVYHNGINAEMEQWIQDIGDDRILYMQSATDTGMWGCANRQAALSLVQTPYITQSSVQDYYTRNAIQDITEQIGQHADLITWQAINHLFRYNVLCGELMWGHIDWGQYCTRTEYMKQTGIVQPTQHGADWLTLQEILKRGLVKNYKKINTPLTIHN